MGKITKLIHEELIDERPDRHCNFLRVYEKGDELVIHFRNFKINLITPQEIAEWKAGFAMALENFKSGNYLQNDI